MTPAAELITLSQSVGHRVPHWVQGAGGNLSVKDGSWLLIKASGIRLDSMKRPADLVRVDMTAARSAISAIHGDDAEAEAAYAAALKPSAGGGFSDGKPSMETGMHLFLPGKWVFHFHSLAALVMAHEHRHNHDKFAEWAAKHGGYRLHMTPPIRPGLLLCRYVQKFGAATFFVLENHGVLVQGDTPVVIEEWESLEHRFCLDFGYEKLRALPGGEPIPMKLYFPDSAVFADRLRSSLEEKKSGSNVLYTLKADAESKNKDAAEIWKATQILYAACPQLAELPQDISQTVGTLPTEAYRINRQ